MMSQQHFDQLLQKYLAGDCNKAEEILVQEWYQQLLDESELDISAEEKEDIRKKIWARIETNSPKKSEEAEGSSRTKVRAIIYSLSAAAAVLVAIFGVYWYSRPDVSEAAISHNTNIPPGQLSSSNNSKVRKEIKLTDGTIVLLQPGATLFYPRTFNTGFREVYLTGSAFFEVSHDTARRFLVRADNLVTEVLGTSFSIQQDPSTNKLEVEVVTGKVSVYQQDKRTKNAQRGYEPGTVILTPNQKVTYNAKNSQFITSLVEEPKPFEENDQSGNETFVYEDVTIAQVLDDLRKSYGIEISTDNKAIENCRFTGDITKQDLYKKLEIICHSLPSSSYEVRGVNIIVKGKGCDEKR